jgi:hypothetical protein
VAQDRDQVVGSCEHGNETSGFIKGQEFLDQPTGFLRRTAVKYGICLTKYLFPCAV